MMKSLVRNGRVGMRAALLLTLAGALGGCASTVKIGDLLAEPQRFDNKTVRIQGTVVRSVGILGTGGYEVSDGTGQIFVLARGTGVPAQGSKTKVKGTFEPIFSLGGRSLAVILPEARQEEEEQQQQQQQE